MQRLFIAGNCELSELLECDFETGKLFWRVRTEALMARACLSVRVSRMRTWNARYAGVEAFTCLDGHGYLMGRIFGKPYKAHRVIWALAHGGWPSQQIDHANGIRTDNRLANIRSVDQSGNNRNMRLSIRNKSGTVGVNLDRSRGKWMATINSKIIGRFDTKSEAIAARLRHPEASLFSERHGS